MKQLIGVLFVWCMVACIKNRPPVVDDLWAAERVHLNMISSDTGTRWKVNEIALNYAKWSSDSNRYYNFLNDTIRPSNQEFYFRNNDVDSGTYKTGDIVAQLLRIPVNGKFIEEKGFHTSSLVLRLQRPTANLQVNISKRKERELLIPGKYQLMAIYIEGDIWHRIELSLSPG